MISWCGMIPWHLLNDPFTSAQVETASLGEVAAAMFLQAASLGSAELSTAGCEIVSQWVRAIVPNVKNIASQKPPEPKSERDLAQHGYYDWVLTEMREARPE